MPVTVPHAAKEEEEEEGEGSADGVGLECHALNFQNEGREKEIRSAH